MFPWAQIVEIPIDGLEIGRDLIDSQRPPAPSIHLPVSRRHARVFWQSDGDLYVEDLRSANGTTVDGVLLAACVPRLVRPGQTIGLAKDVCIVELLELSELEQPL
jgi:pSer/pThr/pTyr-binding forkhead associated (FHA) protein